MALRAAFVVAAVLALAGCRGCGAGSGGASGSGNGSGSGTGTRGVAVGVDAGRSALCREVHADKAADGRWSVQFDTGGPILAAHEARFERHKLTPNGPAWVGVLEQCMTASTIAGVEMNEEAGAFFAWADSDAAKDRLVAALCRALDDVDWLERCIAHLDPARL